MFDDTSLGGQSLAPIPKVQAGGIAASVTLLLIAIWRSIFPHHPPTPEVASAATAVLSYGVAYLTPNRPLFRFRNAAIDPAHAADKPDGALIDVSEITSTGVPPAYLKPLGRRDSANSRACPLAERFLPLDGPEPPLWKVIDFLDVEHSARYAPENGHTYCNVYACDVTYLCDVYLPRVWWKDPASVNSGSQAIYGHTVQELNANALHDWLLSRWSQQFGWEPQSLNDLSTGSWQSEIQDLVNDGQHLAVIAARRKDRMRSGHITIIVPELPDQGITATRDAAGNVSVPLQSQAGAHNRRCQSTAWYESNQFDSVVIASIPLGDRTLDAAQSDTDSALDI